MRSEPTTCPNCRTWVQPRVDGTCPSCQGPIAANSPLRERSFTEQMASLTEAVTEPFEFPTQRRKRQHDDQRRQRRATWLRRARGAFVVATGAILGGVSLGIAHGVSARELAVQALATFAGGLIVGPLVVLWIYYMLVYSHGSRESRFDFTNTEPSDFLFTRPWRYFRFPVWASPALFAGLDFVAGTWSWLAFGFAAFGSLAGVFACSLIRGSEAGQSLFE